MAEMRKVRPGERLDLPAATFNTFIDVAKDFRERQAAQARNRQPERLPSGVILVRNDTGTDLPRFSVVEVDQPVIAPGDNEAQFLERIAMTGIVPGVTRGGNFAILQQPLKFDTTNNPLGRAMMVGITAARVEIRNPDHFFADMEAGRTDALISSHSGSAEILWYDDLPPPSSSSSSGAEDYPIVWALVRLAVPSRIGVLHTVVYRHKDEATGCIFVECKETIGLPNQFDPDSPSVWALAGPKAPHVAGDLVMLQECKVIPGFIENSTAPAYVAVLQIPVDEATIDEPVAQNTVHANVPPPQPTPDPEPCLVEE